MKYRPLMILGTGSDVGKSLIAAALCRIFSQEGIRVAPFKAQNMALNSFITPEGGEMGRAQVVQAQAAGIVPHVDMNPILLKPTGEAGSQVIVHGKVYGNLKAKEYYEHRPHLIRKVMASFRRLAKEYDLIILEGAGSAAELNLKKTDLVNFSMAKRADAAVILVADIDRGGVFAATIGTFHLLTRKERDVLSGFIINKFRGDPVLFENGIRIIESRTKRPVLGVVPYANDLVIPEEDSVALDKRMGSRKWSDRSLRIGVVRLPRISNYTDFDPLEQEQGAALRYLDHRDSLQDIDLLILPGSKNTISDLKYLKQTGLSTRIRQYAQGGGRIIGVCGGYQMLGQAIKDPLGVEGDGREEQGLELLPVTTTMAATKTTTQVVARPLGLAELGNNEHLSAYEIHMGTTHGEAFGEAAFEIIQRNDKPVSVMDGCISSTRRIWGTYLHGVFENDSFRRALLRKMADELKLPWSCTDHWSYGGFQQEQFDRLANLVRQHVDVDRLRAFIERS